MRPLLTQREHLGLAASHRCFLLRQGLQAFPNPSRLALGAFPTLSAMVRKEILELGSAERQVCL
jgi:hypothetical protein